MTNEQQAKLNYLWDMLTQDDKEVFEEYKKEYLPKACKVSHKKIHDTNHFWMATDDRVYRFEKIEDDHRIHILKHGEPWVILSKGSSAVLTLMKDVIKMMENPCL